MGIKSKKEGFFLFRENITVTSRLNFISNGEIMISKKLVWLIGLFPFVFLVHDLEEIMTIERFLRQHSELIPYKVITMEFALAFFFLWIIVLGGCIQGVRGKTFFRMEPVTFFSLLIAGVFLANGISHILQLFFFRSYVPGVITTIFILIPYCMISIKFLMKERLMTINKLVIFLFLGFILQTPFALAAILIAKILI